MCKYHCIRFSQSSSSLDVMNIGVVVQGQMLTTLATREFGVGVDRRTTVPLTLCLLFYIITFNLNNDFPAFKIPIFFCSAQDRTIEAVHDRVMIRLRCGLHLFFAFQAIVFIFILF